MKKLLTTLLVLTSLICFSQIEVKNNIILLSDSIKNLGYTNISWKVLDSRDLTIQLEGTGSNVDFVSDDYFNPSDLVVYAYSKVDTLERHLASYFIASLDYTESEADIVIDLSKTQELYGNRDWTGKKVFIKGTRGWTGFGGIYSTDPKRPVYFLFKDAQSSTFRIDPGIRNAVFEGHRLRGGELIVKASDYSTPPNASNENVSVRKFDIDCQGKGQWGLKVETSNGLSGYGKYSAKGYSFIDIIIKNARYEGLYAGWWQDSKISGYAKIEDAWYIRLSILNSGNDGFQIENHINPRVIDCKIINSGTSNGWGHRTGVSWGSGNEGGIMARCIIDTSPETFQTHTGISGTDCHFIANHLINREANPPSNVWSKQYSGGELDTYYWINNTIEGKGTAFYLYSEQTGAGYVARNNHLIGFSKDFESNRGGSYDIMNSTDPMKGVSFPIINYLAEYDINGYKRKGNTAGAYSYPYQFLVNYDPIQEAYDKGKEEGRLKGFEEGKQYVKDKVDEL